MYKYGCPYQNNVGLLNGTVIGTFNRAISATWFTSLHGTGIATKTNVPQNTESFYYIEAVYAVACTPAGNHCMDMGSSGQTSLHVNATRVPKGLPLGAVCTWQITAVT